MKDQVIFLAGNLSFSGTFLKNLGEKMDKKNQVIILLLLCFNFLLASNAGKTGLSFLKIGIDARAAGMAEAYTAVTEDASAVYWNPAGLLNGKKSNIIFNHNEWIQDVKGEFAAISFVRKKSAWGFHLRSLNIGDIPLRQIPTTEPLEKISAHYLSIGLSYARKYNPKIYYGFSIKYLYERIYVESANGYAIDVGLIYQELIPKLRIAATLQNLGKMNRLKNEKSKLPIIARLGGLYHITNISSNLKANLAADFVLPLEENTRFNLGVEFIFMEQLVLRGGYQLGYEARDFGMGVGFKKSSIRFDYGINPFGDNLGTTHRFTINFNL
jgi:hypothetical protein